MYTGSPGSPLRNALQTYTPGSILLYGVSAGFSDTYNIGKRDSRRITELDFEVRTPETGSYNELKKKIRFFS